MRPRTDTQTHRHTDARDHNTFLVVFDSRECTVDVDDAMKDRMFAFKVSTIVLAVLAGVAIILIIILIRYFVVRQRTSRQYYHQIFLFLSVSVSVCLQAIMLFFDWLVMCNNTVCCQLYITTYFPYSMLILLCILERPQSRPH